MTQEPITQFIIPACSGKAFELKKGQALRVIEVEGKQVGDLVAWNLHDFKEHIDPIMTGWMNSNFKRVDKVYSNRYNVMFTVVHDRVGDNYLGGHCSAATYEKRYGVKGHLNCHDILADSVKPFGLTFDDIPGCFNVFMNVDIMEDGTPVTKPPCSEQGDYVDFLAEMDCLVAISACPSDKAPTNDYEPKPLGIKIFGSVSDL